MLLADEGCMMNLGACTVSANKRIKKTLVSTLMQFENTSEHLVK